MSPDSATTATEPAEGSHESRPAGAPGFRGGPAAPPAAAPDRAPASAASALDLLPDIREAFRESAAASNGTTREQRSDDRSTEHGAPGESAASASDGTSAASKPGVETPSRRGAAAKISEQQQEIERLVAEREAERARAAELQAQQDGHARARAERANAAMQRIGDDRLFGELSAKRMRGEVLSYEQDEQLNSMLSWREHAADLWEIADRAHKQAIVAGLGTAIERHGLDRQVAYDAALPELLEHVATVTEARVRRELAAENAELKAEIKGLRTAGAGGRAPTVGGASAPGGIAMPDENDDPRAWLRAGLMADEAERKLQARPRR